MNPGHVFGAAIAVFCLVAFTPAASIQKNDPFQNEKTPPKIAPKKPAAKKARAKGPKASLWPSYDARHADFVRRLSESNASGAPQPEPLSQYLVGEIVITGLFETDDGYGVFLLATPTGNTFFASPGDRLFNGRLLDIQVGRPGYVEDVRVLFAERAGAKGGERTVSKDVLGNLEPKAEPPPEPRPAKAPAGDAKPSAAPPAGAPPRAGELPAPRTME